MIFCVAKWGNLMINRMVNIINSKNYVNLLLLFGIIYCFYPVSSFHSTIGIASLIFIICNYKKIVLNSRFYAVTFFCLWLFIAALANYEISFWDNFGIIKKNFYFYFFFIFLGIYFSENVVKKFLKYFVNTASIFTVIGFIEVFSGEYLDKFYTIFRDGRDNPHLIFSDNLNRLLSVCPKYDPNYVGFLLTLPFIMSLYFTFKESNNKLKWSLYSLFFGIGIIFTGSRGAILIAVCSIIAFGILLLWFTKEKKYLKYLVTIILLICGSFIVINSFTSNNILSHKMVALEKGALYDNRSSEGMRIAMAEAAVDIIKENPLTGLSFTGFREYTRGTTVYSQNFKERPFSDPHNLILSLAVEGGLPVALTYIYLLLSPLFIKIKKTMIDFYDDKFWILGWVCCYIFTIPFEYSLRDECRFMLIYIFFALIIFYCNYERNYNE